MSLAEPEIPVLKTPEWLEALEKKRNRPHKLAHDIGAGAPCLVCKDRCSGLHLHFWRKLCIECKCRKEDHEVQEEEDYAQFEILFGTKKVKSTTLKFNAQTKLFDWIPPNVSPDLAIDYLKSIPQSKLPISNTEGARHRKQQLEKQVPLHDVNPNACFNLTDGEIKEFGKYLDNLKVNVIGQGKILKYQSHKPLKENYIRATSPDMLAISEDYSKIKPQVVEVLSHLAVDIVPGYDGSSKSLNLESCPADVTVPKHSQSINLTENNLQSLKTNSLEKNGNRNQDSSLKVNQHLTLPRPYHPNYISSSDQNPENFNQLEELKKHSSLIKNFMVDNQNNYKQVEDNCNEYIKKQIHPKHHCAFQQDPYNAHYDPLQKFANLSISSSELAFVPVQETQTIHNYYSKQIQMEKSVESDPDTFPSPPSICQQCLEILNPEEIVIQTERAGNAALWHAKCFVCCTCKELLVDLMYFYHKEKVYCGRHYAEVMKIPRCYGCDELIFVKEYTIAEGESYHVRHFCCFHCDKPLGGQQYISKDNYPICLDCYQFKYGKNCRTCGLAIGAGEQRVSWKDLDFHAFPKCFRCATCSKSLLGGKFMVKNENTFCSKDCALQFPG